MKLIERYIKEVETYLPEDIRDDVADELRSNLGAALDARPAEEVNRSRQEIEIEILTELGPPHQLADSYVPRPRVLFGPRLYPPFLRTLKITMAILVALAALGVAVDFSSSLSLLALGKSMISALGRVLTGGLIILGIAVVVFTLIERSGVTPAPDDQSWDPTKLPEIDDPDKISLGDLVASIGLLVVALVVLNFFRDRIGAHVTVNDESGWIPMLGAAFDAQLWILNLCLLLDLSTDLIVLLRWRLTIPLRWVKLMINCLYVTWLWRLATGPSLLQVDTAWMVENGWSTAAVAKYQELVTGKLAEVISMSLKLGLVAALVGLGIQLVKVVRRTFGGT